MSLFRALSMATTVPVMGSPVFLELGSGVDLVVGDTTASSITSASISPPGNARIIVPLLMRSDAARTASSVTAGFATVAGFTKLAETAVENPGGTFFDLSLWEATTTAAPGSGTIVGTFSGDAFQRAMGAAAIPSVGSRVTQAAAQNTTGTTISIALTGAVAGDAAVVCTVSQTGAGTLVFADGLTHADNSPLVQAANFVIGFGTKVSPSATQQTTGLANNFAHLTVGALYGDRPPIVFTEAFTDAFRR